MRKRITTDYYEKTNKQPTKRNSGKNWPEQIAQKNDLFDINKQMKLKNETTDINFSSLDSKLNDVEEKVLIVIFLTVIIFGFFWQFSCHMDYFV